MLLDDMDESMRTIDDIRMHIRLGELNRTIRFARLRCLSVAQIFDRISNLEDDDANDYVYRLSEMQLTDTEIEHLVAVMDEVAQRSEYTPAKLKAKLDRRLLRLVRLLPSVFANHFAEPFVSHRRKARRQWAYSALREKEITESIAVKLLEVFHQTGDQEALKLIARNPPRIPEIGAQVLLENLEDEYWRARVVEALLLNNRQVALAISSQYPIEFAHAAGRVEDTSLLGTLSDLFDHNQHDIDFLSMYAYALGKLQGRDLLQSLEKFLAATYDNGCNIGATHSV